MCNGTGAVRRWWKVVDERARNTPALTRVNFYPYKADQTAARAEEKGLDVTLVTAPDDTEMWC